MQVQLVCDPTQTDKTAVETTFVQEHGNNGNQSQAEYTYVVQAKGLCACPGKCGGTAPRPGGGGGSRKVLQGGTGALVIFFRAVAFPYLLIGGVLMKRRGESGTYLLVHRDFWAGIPSLAKDGCSFTLTKCLGWKVQWTTASKYEVL